MIIYYKNKKYDITKFLKHHPGGSHVLKNVNNQNITSLIYTYHQPCSEQKLRNFITPYLR
jgi:cytochrome b involved in lipid metabolism